ncbi:MAG: hypothetical protein HC781_03585 [Leptolyngbyaceae cyanobacterium CSU_1_4]|nr:hypothetical protein [Leptolyngbyaceae cyanobacterium CSU_1_4]
MPFIFIACLFLSVWLTQAMITFPLNLWVSCHLPVWLSLVLGGILFSWLFGE